MGFWSSIGDLAGRFIPGEADRERRSRKQLRKQIDRFWRERGYDPETMKPIKGAK